MEIYFIIYLCIITAGFFLGLSFFKKSAHQVRPITIYLGMVLFLEISSHYMAVIYRNNMPGLHISIPLYFLVIGIFFYRNIADERIRQTIPYTIGALLIFAIVNAVLFQPMNTFPGNVSRYTSFVYIVWAALLFIQHLDHSSAENIFKNPVFVAATAILWFNIISLSFFLLYPFMIKYKLPGNDLQSIHYFSNYVYYILLLLAIVFAKNQIKNDRAILQ